MPNPIEIINHSEVSIFIYINCLTAKYAIPPIKESIPRINKKIKVKKVKSEIIINNPIRKYMRIEVIAIAIK